MSINISHLKSQGTHYLKSIYQDKTGFIEYKPGEKEKCVQEKIFLTYGEILPQGVDSIIKHLDIKGSDVFYDLGSGIGKVGLQFFLKTAVKKVCGIEFYTQRHAIATNIYEQVKSNLPELFLNNRELKSIKDSFLKADICDATIIYTCSTCFSEQRLSDIATIANSCPKLRYIISLKPILVKLPLSNSFRAIARKETNKIYV